MLTSVVVPIPIKCKILRFTDIVNHVMPAIFIKEKFMFIVLRLKELRTVNVCNNVVNNHAFNL